jgi:hypothetical protein
MQHHHADPAAARTTPRSLVTTLLAGALLAIGTQCAAAANIVPGEFQGAWVPVKKGCDAAERVLIAADRLILQNGKDSESLAGIEMAGPGYFPPGYAGIMAVLLTESSGDQPVTATFNVGEKRGTARLDFAPVMPGKGTAQLAKYNAHISGLDLARRFPIDKVLLKRCPGVAK